MMVFDRFVIALGAVVDDATVAVENLARHPPRHLPARLKEGRVEVARCRGTSQSGAQCIQRPVSGSAYCYQHRNQAKSAGRLLVVIEARDKAARLTSYISRKTRAATVTATTRLAALSLNLRAQVLAAERISGVRQVASRMVESLQHGADDVVENLARHLPGRLMEGHAEVVRCHGTTQSDAQCKRRPVAGSAYCFQHRDQAKSNGRLFIVLEARDKAARMTSDLSRKTWAATVTATSRLTALSPELRAQVLSGARISGLRRVARGTVALLQARRKWVTSAMVVLFVAAIPTAFLTAADGDLDSLARFAAEIIPRSSPAREGDPNSFSRQETPTDDPDATGLFTMDEARTPGTDFSGAYVSRVEHLSADSSMIQIFVPAGVEGTYRAVVTASEGQEYECVILPQFTDQLYCIGPPLPEASKINLQIFKIDEVEGFQSLVFETNYTTGEFAPLATPSPALPTYGGAFIWPDRFDRVEIRKEQQSSARLSPPSALLGVVLLLMYRMLSRREHRLNRRLVESHEFGPLH